MLITILATLFVLGVLIIIHELGHFWAARLLGITAEKFSFGFGPKLVGIKRGQTEYLVSLIPFGGYVKLKGENPDEAKDISPDSFSSRSPIQRMLVVFAGPFMNLLFPFLVMPVIFLIGYSLPYYETIPPTIGSILASMPAEKAGLKSGDIVLSVDGKKLKRWSELQKWILLNPEKELLLTVKRDNETLQLKLTPAMDPQTGSGYAGIMPVLPPAVGGIKKGSPAEDAGIKPDDMILSIDGEPVKQWIDISNLIKSSEGRELQFEIQRKGDIIKSKVTPVFDKELGFYVIGIEPRIYITKRFGIISAISEGIRYNVDLFTTTFVILKKLFSLELPLKSLGGPITIAAVSGEAAKSGFSRLIELMLFISVQLGIINLIPFIPILDGALIAMLFYELLRGKEMNMKVKEVFQQIGIALIILLMLIVTFNDINRLWGEEIIKFIKGLFGKFT